MLEELQIIFNGITGCSNIELNDKTRIKDLSLSSLGLIRLICEIEDKYDIEITNAEIKNFKLVKDVVLCINKKINTK